MINFQKTKFNILLLDISYCQKETSEFWWIDAQLHKKHKTLFMERDLKAFLVEYAESDHIFEFYLFEKFLPN